MAITYISSTDPFVGYNHPFYPNIIYRAGAYIKTQLEVEHNTDGTHPNREHGLIIEEGTYTGNATPARAISLTNSNLMPLWIGIYIDNASYYGADFFNVAGILYGYPTSVISAVAAGSFTITNSSHVNGDTLTYYYVVLGYDDTSTWTGTADGSTPTWIVDGDTLDADVAGTGTLNQVAKHIEDAFLDEHNDNGTHKTSPFSFFVETGAFTPNGNDDRDITLDTAIDIKALWILTAVNAWWRAHVIESCPSGYGSRPTSPLSDWGITVGTGTFQVDGYNNAGSNVIYFCVIGE